MQSNNCVKKKEKRLPSVSRKREKWMEKMNLSSCPGRSAGCYPQGVLIGCKQIPGSLCWFERMSLIISKYLRNCYDFVYSTQNFMCIVNVSQLLSVWSAVFNENHLHASGGLRLNVGKCLNYIKLGFFVITKPINLFESEMHRTTVVG